jgi:hypothetical protein
MSRLATAGRRRRAALVRAGARSTEFGFYYVHYHSRTPLISGFRHGAGACKRRFRSQLQVRARVPEDIDLFAVSFSNEIGRTGIALQGELSYRLGQPLQVDDAEILYAGFTPIPGVGTVVAPNQLGVFGYGDYIRGWRRKRCSSRRSRSRKLFGPTLEPTSCCLGRSALPW